MTWLSPKWPALVGIFGWLIVTKLSWTEIPVQDFASYTDEDTSGMGIVLLIFFWWGYFFGVAIAIWFLASWLKSRSLWLLLLAPAIALWVFNKTVQIASSDFAIDNLAISLLALTTIAALPILLGASSHISACILKFRHLKSAVD